MSYIHTMIFIVVVCQQHKCVTQWPWWLTMKRCSRGKKVSGDTFVSFNRWPETIKIERILCLPVLSFFLVEAGNFFSTRHIIDIKIRTWLLVFTWNNMNYGYKSGLVTAVFTLPMPVCICSNFKSGNEDGLILPDNVNGSIVNLTSVQSLVAWAFRLIWNADIEEQFKRKIASPCDIKTRGTRGQAICRAL